MSNMSLTRHRHFNPRPPWGGRPSATRRENREAEISIHALRGEGDGNSDKLKCPTFISIHALRGEGDRHHS